MLMLYQPAGFDRYLARLNAMTPAELAEEALQERLAGGTCRHTTRDEGRLLPRRLVIDARSAAARATRYARRFRASIRPCIPESRKMPKAYWISCYRSVSN